MPQRLAEIREAVSAGADEIDIVITRTHVLTANWQVRFGLYGPFLSVKSTIGFGLMQGL